MVRGAVAAPRLAAGVHGRRVHYLLVSTAPLLPDGRTYENTEHCYQILTHAICDARYLELIPPAAVIDRRNPDPVIFLADEEDRRADAGEIAALEEQREAIEEEAERMRERLAGRFVLCTAPSCSEVAKTGLWVRSGSRAC